MSICTEKRYSYDLIKQNQIKHYNNNNNNNKKKNNGFWNF